MQPPKMWGGGGGGKTCHKIVWIEHNKMYFIAVWKNTIPPPPIHNLSDFKVFSTGTCFIQKIYAPSSSLLQGKHLPFTPSPLRLNIFRLFVILSLTQLYRYTPEIFLFSTATFRYKYRAPLRRIGQEYSAKVAFSIFQSLKRIQSLPVRSKLI